TITCTFVLIDSYQILHAIAHAPLLGIETNVTKQLQRPCSQIAACWIENRIVVGKWHVFEPRRRHFFVKRGPAAVVTLEAELPTKRTAKDFVERLSVFRLDQVHRHSEHRSVVSLRMV